MKKIIFTLALLFCGFFVSGCAVIYHPEIQQGNIIEKKDIGKLQIGMSKAGVRAILGTPVLENTFEDNNWLYVYTDKKNHKALVKKQLGVQFENGKLVKVTHVSL